MDKIPVLRYRVTEGFALKKAFTAANAVTKSVYQVSCIAIQECDIDLLGDLC